MLETAQVNLTTEISEFGETLPVPEVPEKLQIDFHGLCNLKCPKCIVHGEANTEGIKFPQRFMSLEEARQILDEVTGVKTYIEPQLWNEPLLRPLEFRQQLAEIKKRNMAAVFNTNGLLMTNELAKFFVEIQLDSVSVSIDAHTPETLIKVRATDKLDKIREAVWMMLRAREEESYPRIGVSFTVEEENKHELDDFIAYWIKYVDVVRVNQLYADGMYHNTPTPEQRVPCHLLYQSMAIQSNGDVPICCLDGLGQTKMGNVFKDGVKGVWHGEEFRKIRHYHETNQYDQVPFCKTCDNWANYRIIEETIVDDMLVRRYAGTTYYNRIDRLSSWKGGSVTDQSPVKI